MTLSITDLFSRVTVEQAKTSLLAYWSAVDLAVTSWSALGKARTILAVVARTLSEYTGIEESYIKSAWLETASGRWLTYLAQANFYVTRIEADAGEEELTLTNASATAYGPYDAGALHFSNDVTGKTYKNKNSIALGGIAASAATDITIVADETGTDNNAAPGEIETIVSPALLGVTCTNAASLVGTDEETDEALRVRCREKLGALSPNGPKEAYAYVAKTPELNGDVSVTRTKVVRNDASGSITVYIASADGGVTGNYTTPATNVYLVHQGLQTYATPQGITQITVSATEVVQNIGVSIWIYVDEAWADQEVEDAINAALTTYFATLDIGGDIKVEGGAGSLFVNALEGVVKASCPVHQVEITTPAANVALTASQVAVLGTVTINGAQVVRG